MPVEQLKVVKTNFAGNDQMAERSRQCFRAAGILAVNGMASPGAGKTSRILSTLYWKNNSSVTISV